jgi:hypothetical protein
MDELGIRNYNLDDLLRMDLATPENIKKLGEIGKVAGRVVKREDFGDFLE